MNNLYPTYALKHSDSGYFFIPSHSDDYHYILNNGNRVLCKNDGLQAKSILMLGNGKLYVISWEHHNNNAGTWFLDNTLNLIANKNLLSDKDYKDTEYAKIWSSYLKDVLLRVWYSLITPNLLQTHPDFSPSELWFSRDIAQDVNLIISSFNLPCQFIDFSAANNQAELFSNFNPPIQINYLVDGLLSFSSYENNWQDKAIINGYVEIKCPFTGELIQSRESLLLTFDGFITAYRFQSQREVFFLITTQHQNFKSAYFFPRRNIFTSNNKNVLEQNKAFLEHFIFVLVKDWKLIKPYLLQKKPRKIVASSREPHIGHHLWQELSSLERMAYHNILDNIDHYYVAHNNGECFGLIDVLFSQLSNKVHRINMLNLPNFVYKGGHLYIRPGDMFISQNLADKIINYSKNPVISATFSNDLQKVTKKQFAIIILFTLRLEDRSWINQEKGICEILINLSKDYNENIALIIDGHNTNESGVKLKSHHENFINHHKGISLFDEEYKLAERIKHSISSDHITVINTIGCSVPESINWCLLCDFFVAPWGAGLAKYKWVTNSPGLVFSSKAVLTTKPDLHIYDSCHLRENATPCDYFDANEVFDVEEVSILTDSQPEHRGNFNLSIDALYKKITEMCERYGRITHSTKVANKI